MRERWEGEVGGREGPGLDRRLLVRAALRHAPCQPHVNSGLTDDNAATLATQPIVSEALGSNMDNSAACRR